MRQRDYREAFERANEAVRAREESLAATRAQNDALAARVQALTAERDELRANWAHDVSTLESLVVQDEAAFRRLRKAYENLVDMGTTQRLAQVRVELDGAYDLLRESAGQVETAEAARDAARAELAAANARIAELEADAKEVADAFIEEQRRSVDMEIERDALSARIERVKAAIREFIDDIDRVMEANPKGQGRKDAAIVRGVLAEILRDES